MSWCFFYLMISTVAFAGEYDLILGGVQFDPLDQQRALDSSWWVTPDQVPESDFRLVQLFGETQPSDITMLEDAGFEVLQYIHPYSYVLWPKASAAPISKRRNLDPERVRWLGYFQPGFRVLPNLRTTDRSLNAYVMAVYVGVSPEQIAQKLRQLGATDVRFSSSGKTFNMLHFQTTPGSLNLIARMPGVYTVQPAPELILRNEFSKQLNRGLRDDGGGIPADYLAWLTEIGLDGSGVRVAVVDSGIAETHPDLVGGMVDCIDPSACESGGASLHGTHVACIIGGQYGGSDVDANGYLKGIGVSPGVEMIEIKNRLNNNIDIVGILQLTVQNGAVMSNNSWGTFAFPLGYDIHSRQVDVGVRDGDANTQGLQPVSYIQAIENGNGGNGTIGAPEEAKNSVRVGSTRVRNSNESLRADVDSISDNSAHGPGLDGRIIPDLVAPGCHVLSANNFGTYSLQCGTSMATPHVTGTAAMFFQYYRGLFSVDPSPALVKAALLTATKSLIGQFDADNVLLTQLLDYRQGYGMLEAEPMLNPSVPVFYHDGTQVFTQSGQLWQETLTAVDPTRPVRIMLVWTDAPGHGLGGSTPALNNNLDLRVLADDETYLGNVFNGSGLSETGGNADSQNNTEGLFFAPGQLDRFELRVAATNIASDAIPDNGFAVDQDFAVVCYNCQQQAGFTFTKDPNDLYLCRDQTDSQAITLKPINGFTGDLTLEAIDLPVGISVTFDPVTAPIADLRPLTVTADETAVAGSYTIKVRATDGEQFSFSTFFLRIAEETPVAPGASLPVDGSVEVQLKPQFVWTSPSDDSFELHLFDAKGGQIATYPVSSGGSFQIPDRLDPFTEYAWQVVGVNPCGLSEPTQMRRFQTRYQPPILVVDDDNNVPDVRKYLTDALASRNWRYDIWDTQDSAVEPIADDFLGYEWVIWFTGNARSPSANKAGPSIDTLPHLTNYLEAGGNFWITSPNLLSRAILLNNANLDFFLSDVLGVEGGIGNSGHDQIFGTVGSPFEGLNYTLQHLYEDRSDNLTLTADASLMFAGNLGNAGAYRVNPDNRIVYWSFSFEALQEADRFEVITGMDAFFGINHPIGCFGPQDVGRRAADIWITQQGALFDIISCVDAYAID